MNDLYLEAAQAVVDMERRYQAFLAGAPASDKSFTQFLKSEGRHLAVPLRLHLDGVRRAKKALGLK